MRRVALAMAGQHDAFYPDLRVTLREFDAVTGDYRDQLIALRDEYQGIVGTLIEEGIADGSVVAKDDPELLLMFMFGALNWMCMWYRRGGSYTANDIGASFADLIERSFFAPS